MEFTPASQNGIIPPTELLSLPSKFGILVSNTSTYYGKPFLIKAVSDAAMYKTEPVTFKTYSNGTTSTLGTAQFIDTANAILVLDTLSTGTHQIWAEWPGEGLYAPTTTIYNKVTTEVAAGATLPGTFTLTVSPASGTIIAGAGTTASFTAEFSTLDVITGNVIFYNGSTQLASVAIEDNKAILPISNLAGGENVIKAVWPGGLLNGTVYQGRSAQVTYQVLKGLTIPTAMSLTVSPASGVYNEGNIKLTATINTSTELPGLVYFSIDDTPLFYAPFVGTTATIEIGNNAYAVGSRKFEALWDGNQTGYPRYVEKLTTSTWTIYERGTINFTNFTVTPRSAYGYDTVFTATMDKENVVGNVGFYTGSSLLGSAPVVGNTATYTTRSLAVGTYTVFAYYNGSSVEPKYYSTTSNTASMVITEGVEIAAPLLITVTNDAYFGTTDPYIVGENQTIRATISTSTVMTGAVRFYDNDVLLGSANWNGQNTATFTTTFATTGSHSIQARWPGQSIGNVFYATKISAVSTVTAIAGYTMGNNITISTISPTIVNQPAALVASITTSSTMTGVVTFFVNGTSVGTSTWTNNVSALSTTIANTGTYTVQARWEGGIIDGTRVYNSKLSTTASHVVVPTVTPTLTSSITGLVQETVPFNMLTLIGGTSQFAINNSLDISQELEYVPSNQGTSTFLLKTVNVTSTSTTTSVISSGTTQLYNSIAYPYVQLNEGNVGRGNYRRFLRTTFNSGNGFNSTSSSRMTVDVVPRASAATVGLYCISYDTTASLVANYIALVGTHDKTHRLYLSIPSTSTSGTVTFTYKGYGGATLSTTATMSNGIAYADVFMTDFAWGDNPVTAAIGGTTYSQKLNITGKFIPSRDNETGYPQYYRFYNTVTQDAGSTMRINFNRNCRFSYVQPNGTIATKTTSLDQTTGKYFTNGFYSEIFRIRDLDNNYIYDNVVDSIVMTNAYVNLPSYNNGASVPQNYDTYTSIAGWANSYDRNGKEVSGSPSYYVGDYVALQTVVNGSSVVRIYRCISPHSYSVNARPDNRPDLWQLIGQLTT